MEKDDISERLAALDAYDILDTPAEPAFDDIVFLASELCQTPVALVSLVEEDRQWFKARIGFEACETPIEQSVCQHALSSYDMLIIPDLTADSRTKANTLVTEPPHIRFYGGAPLITPNGLVIGTLCVIDQVVRPEGLTEVQIRGLQALARQVVVLLESRRAAKRMDQLYKRQRNVSALLRARAQANITAQEAGGIGTFEVDIETGLMTVSAEFCRAFGVPIQSEYPTSLFESMVLPEDRALASSERTRQSGSAPASVEYRVVTPTGEIRWIARDASYSYNEAGRAFHMYGTVQNITDIKQADEDQKLINHELGHRLKNTFAMVQALASQTLKPVGGRDAVLSFEQRLRALSTAHDVLLRESWNAAPLQQIISSTTEPLGLNERIHAAGPDIQLGSKAALNLSLLIHELMTNAVKYGSLSGTSGTVDIAWKVAANPAGEITLTLSWTERGGPPASTPERRGFGSKLISMGLGTKDVSMTYGVEGFSFVTSAPYSLLRRAD